MLFWPVKTSVVFALVALCSAAAPALNPTSDLWITEHVQFPGSLISQAAPSCDFKSLHAESLAGSLKIYCSPGMVGSNANVTVYASADEPGHWPARDWHAYAMSQHGTSYRATIPVEDVEVSIAYFVVVEEGQGNANRPPLRSHSPMRICHPRSLGLMEPNQLFWGFLEGFEQGMGSWTLSAPTPETPSLRIDAGARTGRAALLISNPPDKNSVTAATTQIRGWKLQHHDVRGIRLWLRMRTGQGKARFTLLAYAFTPVRFGPRRLR